MFYENLVKHASPKLLKIGRLHLSCREHKGEVDKKSGETSAEHPVILMFLSPQLHVPCAAQ